MPKTPRTSGAKYRVLVGCNYPPDKRAEPGDVVDDLPGEDIAWMLDQGVIELVAKSPSRRTAVVMPETEGE